MQASGEKPVIPAKAEIHWAPAFAGGTEGDARATERDQSRLKR